MHRTFWGFKGGIPEELHQALMTLWPFGQEDEYLGFKAVVISELALDDFQFILGLLFGWHSSKVPQFDWKSERFVVRSRAHEDEEAVHSGDSGADAWCISGIDTGISTGAGGCGSEVIEHWAENRTKGCGTWGSDDFLHPKAWWDSSESCESGDGKNADNTSAGQLDEVEDQDSGCATSSGW